MLIIDYNEDRQLYLDDELKEERKVQTINPFRAQASKKDSFLYFETICVYGLRIKNA